jgi:tether containing UBX domain for GLUT4
MRLSGLPSGAKLELVQLSKSAGVVSIALQLPESEARGAPNARLTDKFPSSTTLWQLLRMFEAGAAGGLDTRNFTQRGVGNADAGKVCYEQPVVHLPHGRERASFTDLQQTLASVGLNSGSHILRLSFKPTQEPIEVAMAQIQEYFKSDDAVPQPQQSSTDTTLSQPQPAPSSQDATANDEPTTSTKPQPEWTEEEASRGQPEAQPTSDANSVEPTLSASGRPVSVYRPPTSSTPSAALLTHNEADYAPTVEHAQVHQKLLQTGGRNQRLPTEAEIEARKQEESARIAAIASIEIKVRYPDQSATVATFTQADTGADLYKVVRDDYLDSQWQSEPFLLQIREAKGMKLIPDNSAKNLIKDVRLKGRETVTFSWDERASAEARSAKVVLKKELRSQAQELKAPEVPSSSAVDNDPGIKVNTGRSEASNAEGSGSGMLKKPKWLKGFSKK